MVIYVSHKNYNKPIICTMKGRGFGWQSPFDFKLISMSLVVFYFLLYNARQIWSRQAHVVNATADQRIFYHNRLVPLSI